MVVMDEGAVALLRAARGDSMGVNINVRNYGMKVAGSLNKLIIS